MLGPMRTKHVVMLVVAYLGLLTAVFSAPRVSPAPAMQPMSRPAEDASLPNVNDPGREAITAVNENLIDIPDQLTELRALIIRHLESHAAALDGDDAERTSAAAQRAEVAGADGEGRGVSSVIRATRDRAPAEGAALGDQCLGGAQLGDVVSLHAVGQVNPDPPRYADAAAACQTQVLNRAGGSVDAQAVHERGRARSWPPAAEFVTVSVRSDRCIPKCATGGRTSFALHRFGLGDHRSSAPTPRREPPVREHELASACSFGRPAATSAWNRATHRTDFFSQL